MPRREPLRSLLLAAVLCPIACVAYAACTSPAGVERDIIYNNDYHTYQFCNGTGWMAYGGGSTCTASGGYSPTVPSNAGYFVLSGTTWNGNLGGYRDGADALCYTELTVTNTSWMGYATANSNGQLTRSHIHAFICDNFNCNNLMPLTTYYFAVANNGSAGGASFTTDSTGLGPNDSANWSAANYFSGTYTYWVDMGTTSSSVWSGASANGGSNNICWSAGPWKDSTGGLSGTIGVSTNTNGSRWNAGTGLCSNTYNLICFVNP